GEGQYTTGRLIAAMRELAGFRGAAQLAGAVTARTGIQLSTSAISGYERDRFQPSLNTLRALISVCEPPPWIVDRLMYVALPSPIADLHLQAEEAVREGLVAEGGRSLDAAGRDAWVADKMRAAKKRPGSSVGRARH
ncbi:MAG: hypothetical protein ABR552_07970, partial [Actinomycetota bacterium]